MIVHRSKYKQTRVMGKMDICSWFDLDGDLYMIMDNIEGTGDVKCLHAETNSVLILDGYTYVTDVTDNVEVKYNV